MNKLTPYAPVLLRVGLSLVFFWFASNQLMHTEMWLRVVPTWASGMFSGGAATVIHLNAWFEIIGGLMLLTGLQLRAVGLIMGLHLAMIASGFGLSATGVRDYGLAVAAFSLFLHGMSIWSLDSMFAKKDANVVG